MLREFVAREIFGRVTAELGTPDADLRAGLAASQMIGIAFLRYVVHLEPIASAEPAELVAWLGADAPALPRPMTWAPAPRCSRRPRCSRYDGSPARIRAENRLCGSNAGQREHGSWAGGRGGWNSSHGEI